jgi:L-aspartate oxidase
LNYFESDVLIIGTGVAGLACAIKCAERGLKVGIVTREEDPKISNTYWAQGGIIYPDNNDFDLIADIDKASSYTANLDAAKLLMERSPKIIEELLVNKAKTPFEKNAEGEFLKTMEAAHSKARILYRGDFTGKEIEISLLNLLKNKKLYPNVSLLTAHTAIDLITALHHGVNITQRYEANNVLGAYVFNRHKKEVIKILSKVTVLASGGVGAIYLHHSNAEGARGDGHAMAKRAGAILTNMEFIQFHPTTFFDQSSHRRFLVSEAVRGEGARLINSRGESFMNKYHPDHELAPRDIVARAINDEMIETEHECVFLDISHKDPKWIRNRFPTIYEHCLSKNIDITTKPIPVVPAAHYTCGGVKTDLVGKTNLGNLYAIGEVACTGLHGANRLASTSLLEGLTMGYLAAETIGEEIKSLTLYDQNKIRNWVLGNKDSDDALIRQDLLTLKQTMWNYVGLSRSKNRLMRAQAMLDELSYEIQKFYRDAILKDELIGLRNSVEVSLTILNSSLRNKESVGCFYINNRY